MGMYFNAIRAALEAHQPLDITDADYQATGRGDLVAFMEVFQQQGARGNAKVATFARSELDRLDALMPTAKATLDAKLARQAREKK